MGLILDTSVLIDADRTGLDVTEMLARISVTQSEEISLSSVTLMEFASGIARSSSVERRVRREDFVNDLRMLVPVIAFDAELALRTGLLNGELKKVGVTIGVLDLMIGVTALQIDFSVVTRNVKHFRLIPDLRVVEA